MSKDQSSQDFRSGILDQMKDRAQGLLTQLQGFKVIEDEYKQLQKAIQVLSDEVVSKGRTPGQLNTGSRASRALRLIQQEHNNSIKMGQHTGTHPSGWAIVLKDLNSRKLIERDGAMMASNGKAVITYKLTEAGQQALGGLAEGAGSELNGKLNGKPDRRHNGKKPGATGRIGDALVVLAKHPDGLTNGDITDVLGQDKKFKNRLAVNMAYARSKGWIKTHPVKKIHSLTASGKQYVANLIAADE